MRKSDFETKLAMGIAYYRLAILRDGENRNSFYSAEMHNPEDVNKVYLLELCDEHFILRSDLIFDECVERFFYVTRDTYEYSENHLKHALLVLRKTEQKVYDILSKLKLRGFYGKNEFLRRLISLIPQLDLTGNTVKDRKSGKTFITLKDDVLHFEYKDGASDSYMNLANKDLNEKVLLQCVDLITSLLGQGSI